MSKELFDSLRLISSFIVVIPLILSIFKFKSLSATQLKLFYLLIIVFIVEFIANILWYQKINNLPLYHFYAVIEFILIINIYRIVLSKIFPKQFFIILGITFTVFAITNTLFFQNLNTFNSNVTTLLGIIVIFLSLSYFYALLKEVKYNALETNPMFWINAGFLIYFSSNLILFFINNNMFQGSTEASYLVWGLHAIVNIVLTIFYTIALWVNPKKP
ncbi:hypothetical protein D1815_15745 [Aquimarina sp. AD1]|uniref:hypothetical protein n=1 Tax=Aquimarina TaxID=290174 RepID=UPI000553489E|nr:MULTISPECIES: hypothetical protein [Aquimarina]AXT57127.1 hypothetical protein D1815_15745 [Aquimarina sp. AD1]RKN37134.1 hypothetical protein D7035_01105 [Aquimarina sp. AD1]